MKSRLSVMFVLAMVVAGCSVAIEGKARMSVFAPLNREVKTGPDAELVERGIVVGLLVEAGGEEVLARSYLESKGYGPDQVAQRIAVARATAGK